MWADKFDARLTDLFALQDSISERIASLMAVRLNGEEKKLLTRHHTENTEAYQLYLKGLLFLYQGSKVAAQKALEVFDQAIAIDPAYALAYVGKANVYSAYASQYYAPAEAMPKTRAECQKALELDPQLPEAHHSMARIKQWFDWDRRGSASPHCLIACARSRASSICCIASALRANPPPAGFKRGAPEICSASGAMGLRC